MRIFFLSLFSIITVALIWLLNSTTLTQVPLGNFFSPQHGFWQNAEPYNQNYNTALNFHELKSRAAVYFDNRLVPHVFAQNENDAFFIQGYLHAKFRLWQMDFQVRAASGRLSEVVGDRMLNLDRNMRRLGMVYGAENSLKAMEEDPVTRAAADSYTAGVNAYIKTLNERNMPIEFKILGYRPELWSNLKSALFLKLMSLDLAGYERDFELSNSMSVMDLTDFDKLYPVIMDSLDPIIPRETKFLPPPEPLIVPETADSLYFHFDRANIIEGIKPNPDNGSNNWAVSGGKTASGAPILCNDPHLGLNLPSLWYEMQISVPEYNAYGATFPGAPTVIIGFNDHIAFGFTNGMRDVRDYYEVKFKDDTRKEYWFDSAWHPTTFRIEDIKVKGQPDFMDTVAYTNIGPVMYDKTYTGKRNTEDKNYAVRWKAHDASNDMKAFYLLDRAMNYGDYLQAIRNLHVPGQNCVFASKDGDIAIWAQGEFPAKWHRQGDFIMPGLDSSYFWQYNIPQEQNPHLVNPERGFVSSANQLPADTAYPYYLGGIYPPYRGFEINRRLREMEHITPGDMMKLQTDNYNVFGEIVVPEIISRIDRNSLGSDGKKYFEVLRNWNFRNDPNAEGATIFVNVWDTLQSIVWKRVLPAANGLNLAVPNETTLIDIIKNKDSSTAVMAGLTDDVNKAFKGSIAKFSELEKNGHLEWAKFKDTQIGHLTGLDAFSVKHLDIGGGTHTINAANHQHGPSWRMVVSLTDKTEAYGVYPGGQSGNPGSRYYDDFIQTWTKGEYYPLWVMREAEATSGKVMFTVQFAPGRD